MDEKLQNKLKQLAATSEIQEKMSELQKSGEVTTAKIIDFWKAQGIDLTEEDLKAPSQELSDDELKGVSGGGGCGCCVTGGGWGDLLECSCIGIGGGGIPFRLASGTVIRGIDAKFNKYGGCTCPVAGAGATNWGNITPHILEIGEW